MSPNVGNFVHDLVEMAKATEQLPKLQEELNQVHSQAEYYAKQVQELELNAINRKAEIERLNDRIRSLEVERDDASFRVLEAEDREHVILNVARNMQAALGEMIVTLDPPKPEPEKLDYSTEALQPQAVPTATDQSVTDPTSNATDGEPKSEQTSVTSSANSDVTSVEEAPKSDANPSLVSASGDQTQVSASTTASPTDNATSGSDKGPYFNKRYHDMPNYIGLHDWLAGGGSELNYYWQPARDSVF